MLFRFRRKRSHRSLIFGMNRMYLVWHHVNLGDPNKSHEIRVEGRQPGDQDLITNSAKGVGGWARQELAS